MKYISYLLLLFIVCCSSDQYIEEVEEFRKGKDQQFISFDTSPIPAFKRSYFEGLKYFDPNREGVVKGVFTPLEKTDSVSFEVRSDKTVIYEKIGVVSFKWNQKEWKLSAFETKGKNQLFVPFTDLTSGISTYGAGRYLYLEIKEGNIVELDFNYASNPYCAYNETYVCFPAPEENHLALEVPFGEKIYH